MTALTKHEAGVVLILAKAWNEYSLLPVEHPMEAGEFCTAIHACQNMVLARAGRRQLNAAESAVTDSRDNQNLTNQEVANAKADP